MANKRDYRFFDDREQWRDNPYRSHQGESRQDHERGRYAQFNKPEYYGEHEGTREDYGRYAGERHYGQGFGNEGEQYRDRPYSGSSSYSGRGGFGAEHDNEHEPYQEGRRGYGATSTGTGWGSVDTGRHRLGSLTDSAADSAQHLIRQQRTSYAGRGPRGYKRSDERIREDVSEALTRSHDVDATNIEVAVSDGIVTLSGSVDDRHAKRMAEDVAQDVSGVRDVQNQLRVEPSSSFANTENKGPGASETSRGQNAGSVLGLSAEAGGRR